MSMKRETQTREPPSAADKRAALERVTTSAELRSSPQLAAFLRFVVEATLAGDSERIKAYTIALEALGRPDSFDPQIDPIVRVEAGRLRRTLERYYAGSGADDALIVELPRGSYVPLFHWRDDNGSDSPSGRASGLTWRRRLARLSAVRVTGVLLALASLAGLLLVTLPWRHADERIMTTLGLGSGDRLAASRLRPGRGMPVVSVQPFDAVGTPAVPPTVTEGLRRKLRDALARFDEIDVAAETPPSAEERADYQLAATAERRGAGAVNLSFRLIDTGDGTVAWTRGFANIPALGDPAAIQDDVVRQVAATLATPYGVIYARELAKRNAKDRDVRYLCLLESFEYRRTYDAERQARVRACLRNVLALDPAYADGFAAVATISLYDYLYGDGGQQALDEALNAAKRATELAPESARAHQAMMNVLFARGQLAAALAEGEKAADLNPLDMLVLATYGMRLVTAGELARGTAILHQAAALGTMRPAFVDFFLFVTAYLNGDDTSAAFHASMLTSEAYPYALVARALVAAKAGERDRARQILRRLLELHPPWREHARDLLARYLRSPAIVDRLAGDLAAAGLADTR